MDSNLKQMKEFEEKLKLAEKKFAEISRVAKETIEYINEANRKINESFQGQQE